jgi:signal recognition particle GTPase
MGLFGGFNKAKKENLDKGLAKTKESVFQKMTRAVVGKTKVDDDVLDSLEEILITSDVGVDTTLRIIERIEERVSRDKFINTSELNVILREEIASLLAENEGSEEGNFELPADKKPYVIMVVGVNGVGKTTTIGKLAYQFKKAGKKVILGAADTFRAAAVDQISIWADRSTGQNAFEQAKQFTKATEVTSLAITKLDGTAKGGVVIGVSDQLKVPVKYIGIGEGIDDLQVFNRKEFVDSLFG